MRYNVLAESLLNILVDGGADHGIETEVNQTNGNKNGVPIEAFGNATFWHINITMKHRHFIEAVGIFNQHSDSSSNLLFFSFTNLFYI